MTLRGVLIAALAGYYVQQLIHLPYGPAVRLNKEDRPAWSEIDPDNDSLQHKRRLSIILEKQHESRIDLSHCLHRWKTEKDLRTHSRGN
jgi:hypothetical protein